MKERDASMKKLQKNLHDAVVYAVHEIDAYRIDYLVAEMDRCHCPANMVDGIAEHLFDLMNEYAADNDLPEDFWTENYDDDDVVYMAYDIIHEA